MTFAFEGNSLVLVDEEAADDDKEEKKDSL